VVLPDSSSRLPTYPTTTAADPSTAADPPTSAADCSTGAADFSTSAADGATATCRPLQLQRWFCELAGGMVRRKEGMVLQGPWQGLC